MKTLILLVTIFSTQLFARGFVEAQFQYAKNETQKHFQFKWNEEGQYVVVSMRLKLSNYRSDWHDGGFKLDKAHSAYISFPEMDDRCKLEHPIGRIPNYTTNRNYITEITYKLHGEACKELVDLYALYGVVISFYRVPSLNDLVTTEVVRLYLTDYP